MILTNSGFTNSWFDKIQVLWIEV